MGGAQQPFIYEAERSSASFPAKSFDPKAVTRASWQAKPVKPKQEGPLVQINRHPEYVCFVLHLVLPAVLLLFSSLHPTVLLHRLVTSVRRLLSPHR